jgi:hypothetical protein
MKKRHPLAVLAFTIITLGIYGLFWLVTTKNAMKRLGADIPTAWLLILPFINIWWLWKYAGGVGQVTGGSITPVMAFWLMFLLEICGFGSVGLALIQNEFNKIAADVPAVPITPSTPLVA